jgi:hypothetical protein
MCVLPSNAPGQRPIVVARPSVRNHLSYPWVNKGGKGMLKNFLRSLRKSALMKSAARQAQGGDLHGAAVRIYAFMLKDRVFTAILNAFSADLESIEGAMGDLRMHYGDRLYHGHYIPVSTMLLASTFAYTMRVPSGQVSYAGWLIEIGTYFESGAIRFEPEERFHQG